MTPVRIDVVDSAVRHLTITPYADRDRGAGEQTQLEITVNNSSVAARLADARDKCANATPTPTPTIEGMPPEVTPTEGAPPPG